MTPAESAVLDFASTVSTMPEADRQAQCAYICNALAALGQWQQMSAQSRNQPAPKDGANPFAPPKK